MCVCVCVCVCVPYYHTVCCVLCGAQDMGVFYDLAMSGLTFDKFSYTVPTGWDIHLINVSHQLASQPVTYSSWGFAAKYV